MFAAGRSFEQIRNSIGYPHTNVKIGATHAGITVGEDGATHQCNEDLALSQTCFPPTLWKHVWLWRPLSRCRVPAISVSAVWQCR